MLASFAESTFARALDRCLVVARRAGPSRAERHAEKQPLLVTGVRDGSTGEWGQWAWLESDLTQGTARREWLPSPTAQIPSAEAALGCQCQERKESFDIRPAFHPHRN